MATATELKNDAQEALGRAKEILERRAEAKTQEEKDALARQYAEAWGDFQRAEQMANDAAELEAVEKHASLSEQEVRQAADYRNHQEAGKIPAVSAAMANRDPSKYIELAPGQIVPVSSEATEGYVRALPVAVQHPAIMARYNPDLREQKYRQEEAYAIYVRKGYAWMAKQRPELLEALNALQEDTDSEGGYLVPTDQRTTLIFDPGAIGGRIRRESANFTTVRDGGTWPTMTDGGWGPIAEEATPSANDPSFGQVSFTIRKSGNNVRMSEEFLADEASNVVAALNASWERLAGRYEDQQAIEGDGTTEPLGIRQTGAAQGNIADITDLLTLAGPTVTEIVAAWAELPEQFRDGAIWHTTSSFFGTLCGVESSNGGVSFIRELTQSPQRTLMGNRIVFFDGTGWDSGALSITANAEVGCFGNFREYEYFIDRVGMSVRRDDSRYTDTDQVLFKARKRYDSFFVENNAFRILKGAAG